jgi:hypothetical protein
MTVIGTAPRISTTQTAQAAPSPALVQAAAKLPGILAGDTKLAALIEKPQQFPGLGSIDYAPAVKALTPYVFDPKSAPGSTTTQISWEMWGHSVIPQKERDSVMFVIMAEGSAYGRGTTKLTYIDTGYGNRAQQVEVQGKIIAMGIARDYGRKDNPQVGGDECTAAFVVHGKPGEIVKLRYMRLSVGSNGRFEGAGTPDDSIQGRSGAYEGRQMAIKIGQPQHISSPDVDPEYQRMVDYYFNKAGGPAPDLLRLAYPVDKRPKA